MKLDGLSDLVASLEPVASLRNQPRSERIYGLLNAAKPAVASALAGRGSPCLVIAAHPQEARALADELQSWTDGVLAFPALESLPYERVRPDRAILAERQEAVRALLNGGSHVAVASARSLLQPVRRPDDAETHSYAVGDDVDLEGTLHSWLSMGYAECETVEEPGTFARRGGVIDIYPTGSQMPTRIELFGHEIESVRFFDVRSQRSVDPSDSVTVPPLAGLGEDRRLQALEELINVDISSLHAEARTRWLDDLSKLEAGSGLEDLPLFTPYLLRPSASLVEMLPDSTLILSLSAEETRETVDVLWKQSQRIQADMEEAGDLPRGLRPALVAPAVIDAALGTRPYVEFLSGSRPGEAGEDWSSLFAPATPYGGRLRAFAHDASDFSRRRTVITSYQRERIEELLRDEAVPVRVLDDLESEPESGITILPRSVTAGWTVRGSDVALLTDYELFGRKPAQTLQRPKAAAREAFFADFAPGDYVVHIEHGIGRFEGMTRLAHDGAEREYAMVQYAGADRVYVPSEQLERLTRYVGVGDSAPPLNRLGGGEWQRARTRAKQAAAEVAAELIDVYSKRMSRLGHAFEPDTPWQGELESSFPFPETPDQLQTVDEIKRDMEEPRPMDRLVCADVGYGKTEVAVRAAFKAVMDGKQVAVLAPTTILAQQHFDTFSARFEAFPARIEVLSRFRSPAQQKDILRRVASGEVDVLIGTHRLLGKDVRFKSLGLLIVDEEQRFGVRHKEQLKKMRETIDVLTLTATPIPRTLHMGLVGLREISVIETPPEGRLPIKTYLQPFEERLIRDAITRELDREGQVYLVHNQVATIEPMADRIRRLVPEATVLVGHGQMEEAQLERAMLSFARHEADVLISSTIIENGLDIPNVNTIVINHAHRLGLTQLYQLRGRVGRSANQAYAYLLYPADAHLTHEARQRLEAIFEAEELGAGFSVAMRDLEIRGAGNLLGAEQSGHATAIGFDLYTRMIADAVERLRGVEVEEPPLVTIDLPLPMLLPPQYIGSEPERLSLYRRLAAVTDAEQLARLREELRDRFGPPPVPVENLLTSVDLKLLARGARIQSVSLTGDTLTLRAEGSALYDRVALYRRYGIDAKIATNVLRIPRRRLADHWIDDVRAILSDMVELRASIIRRQTAGA